MERIFSAIISFLRSLIGKREIEKPRDTGPDVDQVAEDFYDDMLDADKKRKKH